MTRHHAQQIAQIMAQFNFAEVHDLMKRANWTWHGDKIPPSIPKLKAAAKSLLSDLVQPCPPGESRTSVATGGFQAEFMHSTPRRLRLLFCVTGFAAHGGKGER